MPSMNNPPTALVEFGLFTQSHRVEAWIPSFAISELVSRCSRTGMEAISNYSLALAWHLAPSYNRGDPAEDFTME